MTQIPLILSQRLDGVSESATLRLNSLVQQLKKEGKPVINLTAGEPDFEPPTEALNAISESLKKGRSKYTPVPGIPELREAVASKTNKQQPSVTKMFKPWAPGNVVVSNGGKQSLFNVMLALLNPGDEVIIISPFWLSYPDMARIAGGTPKLIRAKFEDGFKVKPAQLQAALGAKTKMIIINSPSNPSGVMYSAKELRALGEVVMNSPHGKNIWVVSDEIYDRTILSDVPFTSFLEACPELRDQTVTVNGMSKSAAMTGWRIGWTVAREDLTQALVTLQGQSTSGINALAQWASVAALALPEERFSEQVQRYKDRLKLVLDILSRSKKIEICRPEGAFYVFFGVGALLKPNEDSAHFAEELLKEAHVAVVPGAPFGEPQFVRISFATDEKSLQEGCSRIVQFIESR